MPRSIHLFGKLFFCAVHLNSPSVHRLGELFCADYLTLPLHWYGGYYFVINSSQVHLGSNRRVLGDS